MQWNKISIRKLSALTKISLQYLRILLKIKIEFVHCLPYFTSINTLSHIDSLADFYKKQLKFFASELQHRVLDDQAERLKQETKSRVEAQMSTHKELSQSINQCLNTALGSITHLRLKEKLQHLVCKLKAANDRWLFLFQSDSGRMGDILDCFNQLERVSAETLNYINGIQSGFSDGFKTNAKLLVTLRKKLGDNFSKVLDLQYILDKKEKQLASFDSLNESEFSFKPIQEISFIQSDKSDVAFLLAITREDSIHEALTSKNEFIDEQLNKRLHALITLKATLPYGWERAIRQQRVIDLYQRWLNYLESHCQHFLNASTPMTWTVAVRVKQLITYEKKTLFKHLVASQNAYEIIMGLYAQLQKEPTTLHDLRKIKQTYRLSVSSLEKRLLERVTLIQSLVATLSLGITEQPGYQFGEVTTRIVSHAYDQFHSIPIFREPLPMPIQQGLEKITGIIYMLALCYTSNWIGYSNYTVNALMNVVLANVNPWLRLGEAGELLTQAVSESLPNSVVDLAQAHASTWMKALMAFDELSVLEHEWVLRWLSGLGIHLMLTTEESYLPRVCGYSFGTVAGKGAQWLTNKLASDSISHPVKQSIQVVANVVTYVTAYRCGYYLGYQMMPRPTLLTESEALKRLGLFKAPVNRQEIGQSFRNLARQCHPDKNLNNLNEANKQYMELTEAYQFLVKKNN